MKKFPVVVALIVAAAAIIPIAPTYGQDRAKNKEDAQALAAKLKFQRGEVILKDGLATLKVPEGLSFLNGRDALTVLVKLWG
ncbi:MAG: DUF2167 domain-containing protein, partial [Verrucomicrobiota bacterium]|nr:DUF2167 domain-containing protein [Verrucomicrobiota bacterium]